MTPNPGSSGRQLFTTASSKVGSPYDPNCPPSAERRNPYQLKGGKVLVGASIDYPLGTSVGRKGGNSPLSLNLWVGNPLGLGE